MSIASTVDLTGSGFFVTGVMSPDGRYAYLTTNDTPAHLVKVDVNSMTQVSSVSLGAGNDTALSSAISPDGTWAYIGMTTTPGRIVRVRLATMAVDSTLTLPAGQNWTYSLAGSPDGQLLYAGTYTLNPGYVAKVQVATRATLSVSRAGTGTGTVTGAGGDIDCGTSCTTARLDYQDTAVTLAATPAAGSVFTGWSGACSGTGTCAVSLGQDQAVTATFDPAPAEPSATPGGPGAGNTSAALVVSALKPTVTKRGIRITSTVTAPAAGRITQVATQAVGRRTVRRCSGTGAATSAGMVPMTCAVGRAGRRALAKAPMALTVTTTFTPASGPAISSRSTLRIPRRR